MPDRQFTPREALDAFVDATHWWAEEILPGAVNVDLDGPGLGVWTLGELIAHTTRAFKTTVEYVDPAPANGPDLLHRVGYFRTGMAIENINEVVAERARSGVRGTRRRRHHGARVGRRRAADRRGAASRQRRCTRRSATCASTSTSSRGSFEIVVHGTRPHQPRSASTSPRPAMRASVVLALLVECLRNEPAASCGSPGAHRSGLARRRLHRVRADRLSGLVLDLSPSGLGKHVPGHGCQPDGAWEYGSRRAVSRRHHASQRIAGAQPAPALVDDRARRSPRCSRLSVAFGALGDQHGQLARHDGRRRHRHAGVPRLVRLAVRPARHAPSSCSRPIGSSTAAGSSPSGASRSRSTASTPSTSSRRSGSACWAWATSRSIRPASRARRSSRTSGNPTRSRTRSTSRWSTTRTASSTGSPRASTPRTPANAAAGGPLRRRPDLPARRPAGPGPHHRGRVRHQEGRAPQPHVTRAPGAGWTGHPWPGSAPGSVRATTHPPNPAPVSRAPNTPGSASSRATS